MSLSSINDLDDVFNFCVGTMVRQSRDNTRSQRQAATSGVFLSRFHFGPLSKKHVSRDACNPPNTPPPQLPPSRKREVRGREKGGGGWGGRPPSLGSQPLNQTLSHPVNLKQSGFNSSCLSATALAKTV